MSGLLSVYRRVRQPLLAILLGLFCAAIFLWLLGHNPLEAYQQMLWGVFGGRRYAYLVSTLNRASPIIGMGLAAAIAFRAGLFNIGGEGQMILGAVSAALLAVYLPLYLPLPGFVLILLCLLAAMLAGGLYALFAASLQFNLLIPLLITTLLLNYPARFLASYLVSHPFRDVPSGMNQSLLVPEALRLPLLIERTQLHGGVLIILLLLIAAAIFIKRSVAGYDLRMSGFNPEFARYGGIRQHRLGYRVMFSSGAIAGLVGAIEVLGVHYRYIDGMLVQPLYAWTGIMAALLANNSFLGILLSGLFFSALQTGSFGMERKAQVPRELSQILQALIIMLIAVRSGVSLRQSKVDE